MNKFINHKKLLKPLFIASNSKNIIFQVFGMLQLGCAWILLAMFLVQPFFKTQFISETHIVLFILEVIILCMYYFLNDHSRDNIMSENDILLSEMHSGKPVIALLLFAGSLILFIMFEKMDWGDLSDSIAIIFTNKYIIVAIAITMIILIMIIQLLFILIFMDYSGFLQIITDDSVLGMLTLCLFFECYFDIGKEEAPEYRITIGKGIIGFIFAAIVSAMMDEKTILASWIFCFSLIVLNFFDYFKLEVQGEYLQHFLEIEMEAKHNYVKTQNWSGLFLHNIVHQFYHIYDYVEKKGQDDILREVDKMQNVIDKSTNILNTISSSYDLSPISLREILENEIERNEDEIRIVPLISKEFQNKNPDLMVYGHKRVISKMFKELFNNVRKHGDAQYDTFVIVKKEIIDKKPYVRLDLLNKYTAPKDKTIDDIRNLMALIEAFSTNENVLSMGEINDHFGLLQVQTFMNGLYHENWKETIPDVSMLKLDAGTKSTESEDSIFSVALLFPLYHRTEGNEIEKIEDYVKK